MVVAGRLLLSQGRAERPRLPQERAVRTGFPAIHGHGRRLLGRTGLSRTAAGHAKAHSRLRRCRQGHGAGGARPFGQGLGEGIQGRRQVVIRIPPPALPGEPPAPPDLHPPTSSFRHMTETSEPASLIGRAAAVTPPAAVRPLRGLSDRAIAWLFIAPTMLLLLAINIFPLIWTVRLSFTNFRANRPNAPVRWVGLDNYASILGDADVWRAMQATAHFVVWSIVLEV